MRALLDNALVGQDEDLVRVADGGQAVRDGERRSSLHQLFERLLHEVFGLVVQRAGRFVEDQDRRIFQKHPRDGDALLLSAGEADAALADVGIVACLLSTSRCV